MGTAQQASGVVSCAQGTWWRPRHRVLLGGGPSRRSAAATATAGGGTDKGCSSCGSVDHVGLTLVVSVCGGHWGANRGVLLLCGVQCGIITAPSNQVEGGATAAALAGGDGGCWARGCQGRRQRPAAVTPGCPCTIHTAACMSRWRETEADGCWREPALQKPHRGLSHPCRGSRDLRLRLWRCEAATGWCCAGGAALLTRPTWPPESQGRAGTTTIATTPAALLLAVYAHALAHGGSTGPQVRPQRL